MDPLVPEWFTPEFPPLAIYYGGRDYLVDTTTLLERLKTREPSVKVVRTRCLELAEHCDFYYGKPFLVPHTFRFTNHTNSC